MASEVRYDIQKKLWHSEEAMAFRRSYGIPKKLWHSEEAMAFRRKPWHSGDAYASPVFIRAV